VTTKTVTQIVQYTIHHRMKVKAQNLPAEKLDEVDAAVLSVPCAPKERWTETENFKLSEALRWFGGPDVTISHEDF